MANKTTSEPFALDSVGSVWTLNCPINAIEWTGMTAPSNIMPNPGFEDGTQDVWDASPRLSIVTHDQHSGTYCAKWDSVGAGASSKALAITPGNTYAISGWGKVDNAQFAYFNVAIQNSSFATIIGPLGADAFTAIYGKRQIIVTSPAGGTRLVLTMYNAGGGNAYMDDFSVTQVVGDRLILRNRAKGDIVCDLTSVTKDPIVVPFTKKYWPNGIYVDTISSGRVYIYT